VSPKIVSDAWQGRNLPWSSHLRNLASRHGFTPNDFVFLFNMPQEPDHATLWRPAPSAFQSSTGEVRFLRVYLYFPLAAKRTGVPVLMYEVLLKRWTAAHLAGFGVDCLLSPGDCSPGRTLKLTHRLYILSSNKLIIRILGRDYGGITICVS
jgi:hypothetical protein